MSILRRRFNEKVILTYYKKEKKYHSKEEALDKLQRYCVYQDRCHQEVRSKLLDLGIYGDDLEEIIIDLISENFLNEERFARSYARGKFRMKRWGRNRIKRELKLRQISAYCLRKAMEEIDETEYYEVLTTLITKKLRTTKAANDFLRKSKAGTYAISRGYEPSLVWEIVKTLPPS